MSVDENKAVVGRAMEILDALDLDALEEVFSPKLAPEWREGLSALPFSEHRVELTGMVAEGDRVAISMATRGVHSGEWEGVPPTGKAWTNRGMGVIRIEDGKIAEFDFLFDELGHLKQLGAKIVPPNAG